MSNPNENNINGEYSPFSTYIQAEQQNSNPHLNYHKPEEKKSKNVNFANKGLFIILSVGIVVAGLGFAYVKVRDAFKGDQKAVETQITPSRTGLGKPLPPPPAPEPQVIQLPAVEKPIAPVAEKIPEKIIQPMLLSKQISNSGSAGTFPNSGGLNNPNLPSVYSRPNPYNTQAQSGDGMPPEMRKELADLSQRADQLRAAIKGANTNSGGGVGGLLSSPTQPTPSTQAQSAFVMPIQRTGGIYNIPNPSMTIVGGTFVKCVLQNSIDSSLNGSSVCVVSEDVTSLDGKNVLMPKFTRLTGPYTSQVRRGDSRLAQVFEQAITPDNVRVLFNSPANANSPMGESGLVGNVDNRWFERIGTALLLAIFQDGVNYASNKVAYDQYLRQVEADSIRKLELANMNKCQTTVEEREITDPDTGERRKITTNNQSGNCLASGDTTTTTNQPPLPVFGTDASRNAMRDIANKIIEQQSNIQPIIKVPAGKTIMVYIPHDLDFSGIYKNVALLK